MSEDTHIRIAEDTKSEFDEVKDDLNMTQNGTLSTLIEHYRDSC